MIAYYVDRQTGLYGKIFQWIKGAHVGYSIFITPKGMTSS